MDDVVSGYDLVADGSDNFATRYAVSDACYRLGLPLVTAALGAFDGTLTTIRAHEAGPDGTPNPTYRCLFPAPPPPGTVPACSEAGVLGALAGVLGAMMALEVIREIVGFGEGLVGRLLMVDALSMRFETVAYGWDPENPLSGEPGARLNAPDLERGPTGPPLFDMLERRVRRRAVRISARYWAWSTAATGAPAARGVGGTVVRPAASSRRIGPLGRLRVDAADLRPGIALRHRRQLLRLRLDAPGGRGSAGDVLHRRDVLRRLDGRLVAPGDRLRLAVLALQAEHEGEVLAHPRIRVGQGGGPAQRGFRLRQPLAERVGEAEIGQHARLVRADLEGGVVEVLRRGVVAQLVGGDALRGEDAPVRPVRRVGARQHLLRLLEVAVLEQRLAVGGEDVGVLGSLDARRPAARRRPAAAGPARSARAA